MARKRVTRRRSENESEPDQNGVSAENENSNGVKLGKNEVASSKENGESSTTLPKATRSDSDGETSVQPKTNGNSKAMTADDEQQNEAAESKMPMLKVVDMSKLLAKALSSPAKKNNRRSSGSSVEIVNGTIEEIDLLDSSNDSDVLVVPKSKSKKQKSPMKPEKSDSEDVITKSKPKRKQKPAQSENESDADAQQQQKKNSQQDETPTSSNNCYRTVSSSEFDKVTSDFSLVVDKIPPDANKMMKAYKVDGSQIESASSLNESDIELRPRSKRVTKPSRKKIEADESASEKDENRPGTSKSARQTAKRRKRSSSATSSKGKSKVKLNRIIIIFSLTISSF